MNSVHEKVHRVTEAASYHSRIRTGDSGKLSLQGKGTATMRKQKYLGLGAAAAVAIGLTAAIAPAASASTTGPGYLQLCSEGGFGSSIDFVDRGWSTLPVPNGECDSFDVGGDTNETVEVYDDNTNTSIGYTIYNGTTGETIVTTAGPSFYAYNN
jgi:hypothetical protein